MAHTIKGTLSWNFMLDNIASLVSASSILVILVLMLSITAKLYIKRKKKGYRSISISIIIIMIQYSLIISLQWLQNTDHYHTQYFIQLLQVFSFILINMGIYQLYNRSEMKHLILFYGSHVIALGMAIIYFYCNYTTPLTEQQHLLHKSFLDVYLFLLIILCFYLISPNIGQWKKYQLALGVYLLSHLAYTSEQYLFEKGHSIIVIMQHVFPIVYFSIIFFIVLNRIMELLQETYRSSVTDGLTGLYNRAFFHKQLQRVLDKGGSASVIFTDIDNFKKLNDTKGHQAGDLALQHVAAILREESENIGLAGRYGGEELVMMIHRPRVKVEEVAERVRSRVEMEAGVTVSVGYAKSRGKSMKAETLLKQADEAMYISKTTGKNKVTAFSASKTKSS